MNNPFSLNGKVVVVTGASSGIGKQTAICCAGMGARVVLIARNEGRLQDTLSQMEGSGHLAIPFDLTDYQNADSCIKHIVEQVGPIYGLVNCAGVSATLPLKLVDIKKMEEIFHTNVFSGIQWTRQVCRINNISHEGASIIFISSIMGLVGETGKALYSMTKGALVSAVRSLACEFAPRRIRFNAISPGAIITPINQDLPHMKNPEARATLEAKHLLGLGETSDVANACVFLLSDASRWITGQNIIVDGGYTAI